MGNSMVTEAGSGDAAAPRGSDAGVASAPTGVATAIVRRLLLAGLAGGHLALAGVTVAYAIARGGTAAASAAVGAVLTIAFFTIGQGIVMRFAEREGFTLLVAGLASYGVRVAGLGLALAAYNASGLDLLDPMATSIGIVVTVLVWTTVEILAMSRMRIPVYDRDMNGVTSASQK